MLKTVMTTCATSLGESLRYAECVREIARKIGVEIKTKPISSSGRQIENYLASMGKPDLVIGDPVSALRRRIPSEIPVFSGVPFSNRHRIRKTRRRNNHCTQEVTVDFYFA